MQPRQIVLRRFGGPQVMRPTPFDPPAPGPGEVQIETAFIGINFADLMQRMGLYQAAPKRPFIPGFEVSGKVGAVGDGVADVKVGDDVAAVSRFGAYTTHLNVSSENLFAVEGLSMEEAAAFPTVYLTAWEALIGMARAREGDRVLVHGGAGGVGLAAIAVANHLGCEVHATTGTPAKLDILQERGVAGAYCTRGDWVAQAKASGRFDIVLEPGGPSQLRESLRVLAPRGRIVMYGAQDATSSGRRNPVRLARVLMQARFPLLSLVPRNAGIMAFHLLYMWSHGVDLRAEAEEILKLVRKGKLPRPHVDKVFSFDEAPAAHQYIHDRRNVGKVLLGTDA